jgi:hypothetical protein
MSGISAQNSPLLRGGGGSKGSRPKQFGILSLMIAFVIGFVVAVLFLDTYLPGDPFVPAQITKLDVPKASLTTDRKLVEEKSFLQIGIASQTDKVAALSRIDGCLKDSTSCTRPGCTREACRPWGHYYQTLYQQRMGKYSLASTKPFQFLEIGYVRRTFELCFKEGDLEHVILTL